MHGGAAADLRDAVLVLGLLGRRVGGAERGEEVDIFAEAFEVAVTVDASVAARTRVYGAAIAALACSTQAVAARWSTVDQVLNVTVANTSRDGAAPHSPANGSPTASVSAGDPGAGRRWSLGLPSGFRGSANLLV
jgi:hypothetical protein